MTDKGERRDFLEYLKVQEAFDAKVAEIDQVEKFDTSFGVDTSTPFESWDAGEADNFDLLNNYRYSPSPTGILRAVISQVPVAHEEVTFIDFGSGKGRVLLVASEFPFKRIIGVELSTHLCDIATRNVTQFDSSSQRCKDIAIRHESAEEFEIPDDAGVFYFYEPFSPAVTERVLENIERSIRRAPRAAVICLVGRALVPVVEGRAPWVPFGPVVKSPDDDYFDARLFAVHVDGADTAGSGSAS
ncbi:class I SAM-dependent methyltransferase [Streptomyces sp. NBC_00059]|uniref:class I SAM-dependent methyltransferase n=1 Tax=Streptomyces sp. NBC_00059 TaxID=2975635 RepID=UPI00224C8136|nr:class I SAM-dependent methyltransferase [Streptomyces sp. NBC_00059]MCX5417300.1 class I SAM-dependent methyltransferase [Streptomyces sp. NBC_00059]